MLLSKLVNEVESDTFVEQRNVLHRSSRSGRVYPPVDGGNERPKSRRIDAVRASASSVTAANSLIADASI